MHAQYLRRLLSIIAGVLLAIAAANLLIDPFDVYRLAGSARYWRFKEAIGSRLAKAEQLRSRRWDVVLLGNSRVEVGLDPQHPGWGGARVYNSGLPGAIFDEIDRAARLTFHDHAPRRFVLCLDLSDFDSRRTAPDDDLLTRLNPSLNPVEYRLASLLSMNAAEKSAGTLKNLLNNRPATDWRMGQMDDPLTTRGRADWELVNFYDFAGAEGATAGLTISQSRMRKLADLLDDASRNGVQVDLVELPTHVIFFQRLVLAGKWDLYVRWIADLTDIADRHNRRFPDNPVKFFDFCSYSRYTTEPFPQLGQTITDMRWYWDPGHFKNALGDLVIDRLTGHAAPPGEEVSDFGVILDSRNVGQFLAKLLSDRRQYLDSHPEIRQMIEKAQDFSARAG